MWLFSALLLVAVGGVVALALAQRPDTDVERFDAQCDLAALEAAAPEFVSSDKALLALGVEATRNVLEHCQALPEWAVVRLREQSEVWAPTGRSRSFYEIRPPAGLRMRVCPHNYGFVFALREREQGFAFFEACELERFDLLSREDTEYIALEPTIVPWALHEILLDSGLSKPLARRYFLALVLASDVHETELSVGPAEPMRNSTLECEPDRRLALAIHQRDELLRPLRVELDCPVPDAVAKLEIEVEASGTWRTSSGGHGRGADLIEPLLMLTKPSSLRIHIAGDTPAAIAVDIARAANVWRSREQVDMKLWLQVDD
jgi:hypothetical protein